jgi:hypothetical protein
MALVAHYDLELHQIDVKTVFLNGDLQESVYMAQAEGFVIEDKEHMGCRLKILFMDLNKRRDNVTLSLIKFLRNLALSKIKWTIVYILKSRGVYLSSSYFMWMTSYWQAVIRIYCVR